MTNVSRALANEENIAYRSMAKRYLDSRYVPSGDPALSNERLPPHIVVEQIQSLIDQLFLPDNILPAPQTFANPDQLASTSGSSIVEYVLQVFQPSLHFTERVRAFVGVGIDGIQSSTH